MDFTLTERETFFRDRVRGFINQYITPRQNEYRDQVYTGERWKVLPVIDEPTLSSSSM